MKAQPNKLICFFLAISQVVSCAITTNAQSFANHLQKTRSKSQKKKTRNKVVKAVFGINTRETAMEWQDALLKGTGNDHDGPMYLADYGDISAVPALLAVLKRNPPSPDGSMVCTRAHCLTALRKLTKANVGKKTEDWEKWWEDYSQKPKRDDK